VLTYGCKLWFSSLAVFCRKNMIKGIICMLYFETLMILNFDVTADPDPAFHSDADPDPASKNNATQIQICNLA
jgi:hypothetical protein